MRRALILAAAFFGWNAAFRLVIEAPMIYFMARSGARFQEIVDTSATNQIVFFGLSCLTFLIFLTQVNPIHLVSRSEIITTHLFEEGFYPAFLRGSVLSCAFALLFLSLGYYKYVGFFIQSDTPAFAILALFLRFISVILMVYTEEFIFRHKLLSMMKDQMHPLRAIGITALLFALAQSFQFHLGLSHILTLCLLGTALSLRAMFNHDFTTGAGLLAGFLVVSHCVFSIPILGNESQGVLLLKYQIQFDVDSPWVRFLTGGGGGLLSSVAVQFILLLDITFHFLKNKKMIWPSRLPAIK